MKTGQSTRLLQRAFAVALGAALLAHAALMTFGGIADDTGILAHSLYNGLLIAAALICLARAIVVPAGRAPWLLIGIGLLCGSAADLYYTVALGDRDAPPVPSLADAGWLAFYPTSFVAVWMLLRARRAYARASLWLDGLLGALAVAAVVAALMFDSIASAGTGGFAAVATNLSYPIGDLLLLSTVIGAIALTGWRPGRMWALLGSGLALSAIADSIYLYETALGTYADGTILETFWPLSALLMAAAAWCPDGTSRNEAQAGWRVLLMPAILMTIAPVLLFIDHFHRLSTLAVLLATAAVAVGIVRMALTFRDNLRMLAGSRHEAMTDALTGLYNRRRLIADLEVALSPDATTPAVLALFDLNGFKSYNDTYGHPAGDQLLARLGGRLQAAVAGHGTAYRIGGDEFCVVVPAGAGAVGDVAVAAAAAALAEHGEGFAITASYGAVAMPSEAAETSEILQLADRRMYAHKGGSTRASAGRQTRDVLLSAMRERQPDLHEQLHDVAELAREVGRELRLDPERLDELMRAAELHDLGKVAIPDAILNKPGPLDDAEWEFMRRHTIVGERILAAAPAMAQVAALVRSSHERWDGGGYPDGLRGDEIPLGSRVVAVCDAFHAMTSDRPYRAGIGVDAALAELRACAGTQFDPSVIDAFVAAIAICSVGAR